MTPAPIAAKPESARYTFQRTTFQSLSPATLDDWRRFATRSPSESPMQDPEWIRGYFYEELDHIHTYLLYNSDTFCGQASFLAKDWPVRLHLGEIGIADLPVRRLRLLGAALSIPNEERLYDLLFQQLAESEKYDALYFTQIPVESPLWRYLTTSEQAGRLFHRYISEAPSLHPCLRLGNSFDEYMKKFNKGHRHTLRRKVTRFQEEAPGEVRLVRYTRPDEVERFLDLAVEVSRKTYQWNLHQRGLYLTDRLRRRLQFAAEHGWFRSYLLFCGDTPYAFLVGYQWNGRYYTDEIGFDPVLAKRSPGTVLQILTLQDMYAYDKPELIDFGSYDKYKEEFANETYSHCAMFLFRRTPYLRGVAAADAGCRFATKTAVRILERLNLKRNLKKAIRSGSVKA